MFASHSFSTVLAPEEKIGHHPHHLLDLEPSLRPARISWTSPRRSSSKSFSITGAGGIPERSGAPCGKGFTVVKEGRSSLSERWKARLEAYRQRLASLANFHSCFDSNPGPFTGCSPSTTLFLTGGAWSAGSRSSGRTTSTDASTGFCRKSINSPLAALALAFQLGSSWVGGLEEENAWHSAG